MPSAKLAVVSSLAAVALAGCGAIQVKPVAATGSPRMVSRGRIDDPRTSKNDHVRCLRQQHLTVREVGQTGLQIGTQPGGPSVVFTPTAGAAQADQIRARDPGAEVIGSALLFPNQAPDTELMVVEDCLAKGVTG